MTTNGRHRESTMNWSNPISWLWALMARRAALRPDEVDRADMGTAFGLDASFGPADEEWALADDASAGMAAQPWEHRLTRRVGL